jgi:hypothetical protein
MAQQLSISGKPVVVEIHDLSDKDIMGASSQDFMVQARVVVPVAGDPPESQRALNYFVTTWVDANKATLEELVHPALIQFLEEEYPDAGCDEIQSGGPGDLIWDDQVDYMAFVEDGKLSFYLDLDVEAEDPGQEQ